MAREGEIDGMAGVKACVSWSGGKDCALALWEIVPLSPRRRGAGGEGAACAKAGLIAEGQSTKSDPRDACRHEEYDVVALLTTVTGEFDRISMHGVRVELLRRQAEAIGIPLHTVTLNYPCRNDEYESKMVAAFASLKAGGVERVICGDLFLEDVRRYREERLFGAEACVFPLWKRDTRETARRFLSLGFKATLCCVDTQALSADFAGRPFDERLLADLPAGVDPCGENGEFHTFVWDGPSFERPVSFTLGERLLREGRFAYCDLVPA